VPRVLAATESPQVRSFALGVLKTAMAFTRHRGFEITYRRICQARPANLTGRRRDNPMLAGTRGHQAQAPSRGHGMAIKITIEVDEDRLREAGMGTTDAELGPRSRPWQTGRG
jgi:hypothetical protein